MESNLGSFCVGIILSLTVSAIDSVGINLLRQDHIVNNAKPASQQLPFIKRKQSVCGMALHLSSQLFGGLAVFNFLPPAVIAPIGSAVQETKCCLLILISSA